MSSQDPEPAPRRFTDRELDIMSVLWARGSGTVAEVRETLGTDVGYTTVLKMLQILEEKGAVGHEQEGRAYRYFPLVESASVGGRAIDRIVNRIFHGSAEMLLATLVEDRQFTDEEIARMRSILDRAEQRKDVGNLPSA
ncbi:MAG: BlaI/MecI/CopY family transcriptional regulator [Gemmatimonadetes bacterium]|nr:BlaI/MecI/CopY family transcriptional regulator [Gemmatimonadota bacterium]MXX71188.1 BlaI/MecI/CopY family transcriptional regulator [Gemmatimonadota bacterium]MYC92318.1 BlaI/MecI/CopY family transcriptional regulator [Gemmatimonadota bacterium]MYG34859.1 BlaI/MecI/CopY family transcriptional regulator [Gemmatimonadota bacterium]MYJ18483.1 BlaI/MecI/CopY family transcriptional regulator [Gemmatimonadota bacterium]